MKIVIASDSHGRTDYLKEIEKKEKADYYLHCGDSCDVSEAIYPFVSVKGNCDFHIMNRDLSLKIGKYQFFMTHGHLYYGLSLLYKAKEMNADIVLTGHTHRRDVEIIDGILFINPGSVARPRDGLDKSYVVFEFDENIKIDKEELKKAVKFKDLKEKW